jgi:hypothetical protein
LVHSFRGFSPSMVTWPHVLGQTIMTVGACGRGHLMADGKERQKRRQRPSITFKGTPSVTYFLPKFPQPPKTVPPARNKCSEHEPMGVTTVKHCYWSLKPGLESPLTKHNMSKILSSSP